jgi:hypothetical protein
MGWVETEFGVWGDDAQDISDQFVEQITNVSSDEVSWRILTQAILESLEYIEIAEVPDGIADNDTPIAEFEGTSEFVHNICQVFVVNVGRLPTWPELINHLALSLKTYEVCEVPEGVGQVGLVSAMEIEKTCYVCGGQDVPSKMVLVNLAEKVFLHPTCLAPYHTRTIEIDLPVEVVVGLVNVSTAMNLPINTIVAKIIRNSLIM